MFFTRLKRQDAPDLPPGARLPSYVGTPQLITLLLAFTLPPAAARAACNLIPQTTKIFDGAMGSSNRPFASPGEPIEIGVRPCDVASAGLSMNITDQLVTVVFTPEGGATRNAAVLTAGSCASLSAELAACTGLLGGGQVMCIEGAAAGLKTVQRSGRTHLQFAFPNTDAFLGVNGDALTLAGPATIAVTQASAGSLPCNLDQAATTCATTAIPGLISCIDAFYANDGTCARAQRRGVFNHFTALPMANDFQAACIDEAPPCNPTANHFRLATDQDGNVLIPMNWSGILLRPGGIPFPRLLSASLSTPLPINLPGQSFFASFSPDGGPLAPIFVPQFNPDSTSSVLSLFGSADAPLTVLRIARFSDGFRECNGGINDGSPCNVADDCPAQCSGGSNAGDRCTSDAACPGGTCSAPSVAACGPTTCVGGANAGNPCTADSFCPGGKCGPGVFTMSPLIYAGVGPVVLPRQPGVCAGGPNSGAPCTMLGDCPTSFCLTDGFCQSDTSQACSLSSACMSAPCVDFELTAESPIPLASLAAQTANVFGLTSLEAVDLVDRNGDGDQLDAVVTMRNSTTGSLQALAAPAECIGVSSLSNTPPPQGRAIVQLRQPPFVFPAVSAREDIVAFLESEPGSGNCDTNSNGIVADGILRVFRLGPTDLTSGLDVTVEAEPRLNNQSLVTTNGLVFFRRSEPARAVPTTRRISVDSNQMAQSGGTGTLSLQGAAISYDGRYVAMESRAQLVVLPGNGGSDVYVRDRQALTTERVSVNTIGTPGDDQSFSPDISADGRYVAFASLATNLVPGDTNAGTDVFVRDRQSGTTERVSVDSAGNQATTIASAEANPAISADGRFVAFISAAGNLVADDTNMQFDTFVHDRQTGATERVSFDGPPASPTEPGTDGPPGISADGRYVVFSLPDPGSVPRHVWLRDRQTGSLENMSVSSLGVPGNSFSEYPAISADGRFIVFESFATNLVSTPLNAPLNVFVRDRLSGATTLVSVNSNGIAGNNISYWPSISADGRYVTFMGRATDMVLGDTNGQDDVFLHDRLMGTTVRINIGASGNQATAVTYPYVTKMSGDNRSFLFSSEADDLVAGDTNVSADLFVRSADPSDLANDLSGDGDVDDILLGVMDTNLLSPSPVSLCPANQVAAAAGAAAFLRAESAGATPSLSNCPTGSVVSGGVDLNGNGIAVDEVVHLALSSSNILNLGRAATAVSLSGTCLAGANINRPCSDRSECPGSTCAPALLAALVSEAGQNSDLNGDGDLIDSVVQVHPAGLGSWNNLQQAADTLQAVGTVVAMLTPEAAQNTRLNSDSDTTDRVLQIYESATAQLTNSKQAAEEFVIGSRAASCGSGPPVAFRTSEAGQDKALNSDNDKSDDVLQVFVPGIGIINTGQAVTNCNLELCNPRQPYLVDGDTVKFLTVEADQGIDLNGNDNTADLILQIYDVCRGTLTPVGAVDANNASANPLENAGTSSESKSVFPTTAGVCVAGMTTLLVPAMCTTSDDCPPGTICQPGRSIIAAPAVVPTRHDSLLLAPKPLNVKIAGADAAATLKLKVRNGDLSSGASKPVHELRLKVSDGTCPAGTVAGLPDFDRKSPGNQDSILLPGGATKSVKVPLRIAASAFTHSNKTAPIRCSLAVSVASTNEDNSDPTSANNRVAVELNVVDNSNPQTASPAESVIASAKPVQVTIARSSSTMSKTKSLSVKIQNVDTATATLAVTANDGNCPSGTVTLQAPSTLTLAGGAKGTVKAIVTATNAAFLTRNAKSPSRCTATLTVTGPGIDPEATNNTTQVVVDVVDAGDF